MKNYVYIVVVFFFLGCKAQKGEVTIHKTSTKLPLKMEIVGKKDSIYILLYVPVEFSLRNKSNKVVILDNFHYLNRTLSNEYGNTILKSYLNSENTLQSPPYRLSLAKGEEKKFTFFVGYYLYVSKKDLELFPIEKGTYKQHKLTDVGLLPKYSKFLNKKIKNRGFIYVLIYDEDKDLDFPDIEIPITF